MRKLYFAYGANTNLYAMAERCPRARRIDTAILRGYALVFRNVADITRNANGTVSGAVWNITPHCEKALDLYEGFPHLYTKKTVSLTLEEETEIEAMVYVMREESSIEPPSQGYYEVIAQGYRDFGISLMQLTSAVERAKRVYNEEIDLIRRSDLGYSIDR